MYRRKEVPVRELETKTNGFWPIQLLKKLAKQLSRTIILESFGVLTSKTSLVANEEKIGECCSQWSGGLDSGGEGAVGFAEPS